MIRRLIPLAVAAAFAVLAVPGIAHAHIPSVSDSCTGLNVQMSAYEGGSNNNRVTVTIDGGVQVFDFGGSFTRSFTWTPTASHVWTVAIDANRIVGNPTEFDTSFNGSEAPCQSTTTSTTTTSTSAPSTSSPPDTTTTTTPATTTTPTDPSTTSTSSTSTLPSTSAAPPSSANPDTTSPTAPPEPLDPDLPATGFPTTLAAGVALIVVALGGGAVLAARRRPE